MGLIRVTGGNSGIKEYLEDGQKEGRAFTRDELDERVVIDGDLELTNSIIQSIGSDGERYLHLTFSLKEDELPPETLTAIAADIKAFIFTAYRPDEFNYYAEAHLPKIKSYTNSKDGSLVERKPHLHIVIPKVNLLSGKLLDPLGKETQQEKFIDALQEHINNKYGLASPKENRRVTFSNASEMISRHKSDIFNGPHKEFMSNVLDQLLERKIEKYEDYKSMLTEFGETRTRNTGEPFEYENIRISGAPKGINLDGRKEGRYVFSREFIELPQAEKLRRLSADIQRLYETTDSARRDPAHIEATLQEWHEIRAKEVKYINSGNRKFFASYKAASREEKLQILSDREGHFYTKYDQEIHHDSTRRARAFTDEHFERITNNLGAASRHILAARRAAADIDRATRRVTYRRAGRIVATAIQRYGRSQGNAQGQKFRNHRRVADNVVGQHQYDAEERTTINSAETLSEFATIRKNLDAHRLLMRLSRTHGVIPEKYEITKSKDGSDRILCGKRNLTVSDFLTKELHLSFAEAAPILRECYAAQLTDQPIQEARKEPTKSLWREYQDWKKAYYLESSSSWDAQKLSETERRAEIKKTFQDEKAKINASAGLSHAQRRPLLSVARVVRVQAEQALRVKIALEREELKTKFSIKAIDLYRVYLQQRAQAGDVRALAELRRQRIEPIEKIKPDEPHITAKPKSDDQKHEDEPILPKLDYHVATNGDVTYQIEGRDAIRDEARAVHVLYKDDQVAETALRLAMQKFGPKISVNGTEAFKRHMVEVAIEKGINVEFTDPALNELRERLVKERTEAEQATTKPADKSVTTNNKESNMEMNRHTEQRGQRNTESDKLEEERKFKEYVQTAKASNLPYWLERHGVKIQKNGSTGYKVENSDGQEHDRLFKSSKDGNWMVHTPGGARQYVDAIEYLRQHSGEGYRETVLKLAGVATQNPVQVAQVARDSKANGKRENRVETAIMLHAATQQQREAAYHYALERGISRETLKEAGDQKVIVADKNGLVFVGYDENGKIGSAETRLLKPKILKDQKTREDKEYTKWGYEHSDKTFPPIFRGNDKDLHFVEGGFDALALRDMYRREGKEPPTTIITGGARTLKWEQNTHVQELIKNAEQIQTWEDNEIDANGNPDLKKQADTTDAHDNQVNAIIRVRGNADGIERNRPPQGIKDVAQWNKQEQQHQQMQKAVQEEEEHRAAFKP